LIDSLMTRCRFECSEFFGGSNLRQSLYTRTLCILRTVTMSTSYLRGLQDALPLSPITHTETNSTLQPPAENTNSTANDSISVLIYAAGILMLILVCALAIPVNIPDARQRRRNGENEEKLQDPVERAAAIDKSLIAQRVVAADQAGNMQLGDVKEDITDDARSGTLSAASDPENRVACCCICLEPYRVGDVVAWSRQQEECLHVFHHECILMWLENPKHDDCPSCRTTILVTDTSNDDKVEDQHDDTASRSSHSTAFVIMHGLISRARRTEYSCI
jgi:Ring finger domain